MQVVPCFNLLFVSLCKYRIQPRCQELSSGRGFASSRLTLVPQSVFQSEFRLKQGGKLSV